MRTTVDFDDAILQQLRQATVEEHTSLSHFVGVAVKEKLARRYGAPATAPPLPVWKGTGIQPGVDLNDGRSLADLMDGA